MAKLMCGKVTQQPNEKPALRLKIMFNLYNLLENPYSRFFVYMKVLNLALNGKVTEHIIPSFKKKNSFLKEWNIDIKDKRELFLGIANVLKENKRCIYYEAKEEAVRTIIEFVKAPDMFQCDLLDMPAVVQLEMDAKYALISDDEVETWVVKAITAKLIDGKMDQMNQVVIVSRCTERVFRQQQFLTLTTKHATWKQTLKSSVDEGSSVNLGSGSTAKLARAEIDVLGQNDVDADNLRKETMEASNQSS
ncbi:hypothetical protein Dsin_009817 [Dipteronia sinensis]|uniref:PCI domain-containing protein n=1 Tax=Dipteronia sinensis TaxID=43782 RepID=A0AAE0ASJ3_9ROSI|nr:hypothetical protein Dsin_009817 [Dipteronia sinensis]